MHYFNQILMVAATPVFWEVFVGAALGFVLFGVFPALRGRR